jgi:hypothetical protein
VSIKAWHFAQDDLRLGYEDGRKIVAGETVEHDGPIEMCASGLHASRNIIHALNYARGRQICRVECSGEIIQSNDKLVCTRRKTLWIVDGIDILRRFARLCARDVLPLWDPPEIVLRYLRTGDENIRDAARAAARAAAWDAARAAAWDAARAAARAAAWDAARAAAWDAVGDAVRAAAREAARDAARAAARDAAREAAWAAARDAANAANAARGAAWDAQGKRLRRMVSKARGAR